MRKLVANRRQLPCTPYAVSYMAGLAPRPTCRRLRPMVTPSGRMHGADFPARAALVVTGDDILREVREGRSET
jgi:hypothetical protein